MELLQHFRDAFGAGPGTAYREWFRKQEELRDSGDAATSRALADDLWSLHSCLRFERDEERARFLHNMAVFFGSPGSASDLSRARECFQASLEHFSEDSESGWQARILHNFATAVSNLGTTAAELEEAISLFERALAWRTSEREIARAVTLHNMGLAWRRLAELSEEHPAEALESSARALQEAVAIRSHHGLAEGHALSIFHLGLTFERLAESEGARALLEARRAYAQAAEAFEQLGKSDSAAIARSRLAAVS